jgi:hypothetical protein
MLLSGPRTSTLGSESPLTCNYIAKSGGGDHLYDSCIFDNGTTICLAGNVIGTGTITGTNMNITSSTTDPIGLTITGGDETFVKFMHGPGGLKNWGIITTNLAAGDFGIYQSNSSGGDPFASGSAKLYFTATGAAQFSGSVYSPSTFLSNVRSNTISPDNGVTNNFQGSGGYWALRTDNSNGFNIDTYNSAAPKNVLNITQAGNIGIGTCNPLGPLEVRATNRLVSNDGILQINTTNSQASDLGGSLSFGGMYENSGTTPTEWAQISGRKENSTSSQYGGYLSFATRPHGGLNTERMRINSAGQVSIGLTSAGWTLGVNSTTSNNSTPHQLAIFGNNVAGAIKGYLYIGSSAGIDWLVGKDNSGAGDYRFNISLYTGEQRMTLYTNGQYAFAGSNVSDIRLKTNINTISINALDKISQFVPKSYYMTDNPDQIRYGFIAQEVKNILPDLISGEEKEKEYLGLDYNGVLAMAIKAIQEQQCAIQCLTNRIEQLENK